MAIQNKTGLFSPAESCEKPKEQPGFSHWLKGAFGNSEILQQTSTTINRGIVKPPYRP